MMKRIRIAIFGASPCGRCFAACCKQNGHEFAALLRDDDERRRFRAFAQSVVIRHGDGSLAHELVLPYRDGRCQFLGADDRCTIYEDRPMACRQFECAPQFNKRGIGKHDVFLDRNPRVRELLDSL
jgi:Fe-S-cluster containining protein